MAVLDYDRDGHPDLFFVNGTSWPWEESLAKSVGLGGCALFHNDGRGHFTNVSAAAGLNVELQGMAAAIGCALVFLATAIILLYRGAPHKRINMVHPQDEATPPAWKDPWGTGTNS